MKAKIMIDKKNIVLGTVLAVVLVIILGMLIPLIGGIIALIVAGIVVGYLVNDSIKVGAVHGALVGLFTGIFYILAIYAISGFSEKIIGGLIIYSLGSIPVYVLIGLGGGIIGSAIKAGRKDEDLSEEQDDAETDEILTEKDQEEE